MLKYLLSALAVAILFAGGFFWFNGYIYDEKQGGVEDYKDITIAIDGMPITLVDGVYDAEPEDPNMLSSQRVDFFGNEAKGDLNGDNIVDLAFLVTESGGGSGTFYYVVAALQNSANRYIGTNAVFLGDRIAPQSTEIRNGILIVNYADRRPDEPYAATPTVGKSMYIYFDGAELIGVPPVGPISIEGTMVCLPHRDTEGPQTLECALGLQDDTGRYFALKDTDPSYGNVSGVGVDMRVTVEGAFKLHLGSKYQDVGVIEVTKIIEHVSPE